MKTEPTIDDFLAAAKKHPPIPPDLGFSPAMEMMLNDMRIKAINEELQKAYPHWGSRSHNRPSSFDR